MVRRGRCPRHRLRHRGRLPQRSAPLLRERTFWCWRRRLRPAVPARWRVATSISAAAPRCSRPPVTKTAPKRCTSTSSRSRRTPTSTRFASTARKASSTSIGLKRLAFSSNAATGRARWWCRRAPRGCPTPATRRCGRSASRPNPRRADIRCRCQGSWAAPRWSSTCSSSELPIRACRSDTRPG